MQHPNLGQQSLQQCVRQCIMAQQGQALQHSAAHSRRGCIQQQLPCKRTRSQRRRLNRSCHLPRLADFGAVVCSWFCMRMCALSRLAKHKLVVCGSLSSATRACACLHSLNWPSMGQYSVVVFYQPPVLAHACARLTGQIQSSDLWGLSISHA